MDIAFGGIATALNEAVSLLQTRQTRYLDGINEYANRRRITRADCCLLTSFGPWLFKYSFENMITDFRDAKSTEIHNLSEKRHSKAMDNYRC